MPVTTAAFDNRLFPPEVSRALLSAVATAAPFAGSLPPLPTTHGKIALPVVNPTGAKWTAEAAPLPDLDLGDAAVVVSACKIGGILALSRESTTDDAGAMYEAVKDALGVAFGPNLDDGLLYGDGTAPNPVGLLQHADLTTVTAPDWRGAAIAAAGSLAGYGTPTDAMRLWMNPDDLAAEYARVDDLGRPMYDGWGAPIGNLQVVPVASLRPGDALAGSIAGPMSRVEASDGFEVAASDQFLFDRDSIALRVTGRFAIAAPVLARAARRLSITPAP